MVEDALRCGKECKGEGNEELQGQAEVGRRGIRKQRRRRRRRKGDEANAVFRTKGARPIRHLHKHS
eukprot:8278995-Pyramimonas_sp.AAC.1